MRRLVSILLLGVLITSGLQVSIANASKCNTKSASGCSVSVTPGSGGVTGEVVVRVPGGSGQPVPLPEVVTTVPINAPATGYVVGPNGIIYTAQQWEKLMAQPWQGPTIPVTQTPPSQATPEVIAEAIKTGKITLPIPALAPNIGPDPNTNEWKSAFVGYPLWLWTTNPGPQTATITIDNITLTLTATLNTTTFTMGDGTQHTCTKTTPYTDTTTPKTPSPTCGHTYNTPGTYPITATNTWNITWTTNNTPNTLTHTTTTTRTITVKELTSVLR